VAYSVLLKRSAEKELNALDQTLRRRIVQALLRLENDPRPRGAKKLTDREAYRLRIGDYRALYTVDDGNRIVRIIAVGHRSDVYR